MKRWMTNNCIDCGISTCYKAKRCVKCARLEKIKVSYTETQRLLNNCNDDFLNWFIGFWEGEGSIQKFYKSTYINKQGQHKRYVGYELTVAQKEQSVLYLIKEEFGFGEVYRTGRTNICSIWSIQDAGKVLALSELILPKLRSKRRQTQVREVVKMAQQDYYELVKIEKFSKEEVFLDLSTNKESLLTRKRILEEGASYAEKKMVKYEIRKVG